jgi:hypothetical protein
VNTTNGHVVAGKVLLKRLTPLAVLEVGLELVKPTDSLKNSV